MTSKLEFFAGPLDGDRLVVPEDVLATGAAHFASHASTSLVHRYEKRAWGMQWEGLVDRAGVARVFALNVGERKQ